MQEKQRETSPVIRISGDTEHPLAVTRLDTPFIPCRKTLDGISQFLQDNGFEDASKAIDCHFDL